MKLSRTQKQKIMAELLKTNKFSSVKFALHMARINGRSDRTSVHFHISYVGNGLVSQDEFHLPHKSYYIYGLYEVPHMT